MKINSRIVSTAAIVALTCVVSAAAYFYRSRKVEINEVMIFCKLQYNPFCYFDKLMSYIEDAKKSVNVCMPSIHNAAIQGRLVKLIKKKRDFKVRILIDRAGVNDSTKFLIEELIDAGAEVRYKYNEPGEYKLQHKFCLVDEKLLMTGTLNWGNDKSCDNWNYVYITNKKALVQPVNIDFYKMWSKYSKNIGNIAHDPSETEIENQQSTIETENSECPTTKSEELTMVYPKVNEHQLEFLNQQFIRENQMTTPEVCVM